MSAGDIKKEIDNKIYFYMEERLIFDSKIKKGYFLVDKFKFTFDKSEDLQQKKRISFTRKAKWRKEK
jgi:hypothetical protein